MRPFWRPEAPSVCGRTQAPQDNAFEIGAKRFAARLPAIYNCLAVADYTVVVRSRLSPTDPSAGIGPVLELTASIRTVTFKSNQNSRLIVDWGYLPGPSRNC